MKHKNLLFAIIILALCCGLWSQDGIPTDNLECWYPFNGNFNDESGNGRHGTNYGATIVDDRNGNPNSCAYFNGNYVVTNWTPPQMEALSISVWFNITSVNWDNFIVSCGRDTYDPWGGFHMHVYYNYMNEGFADSPVPFDYIAAGNPDPVSLNTWYHTVFTYDGLQAKYYVNGQLVQTKDYPDSPPIIAAPCPLCIGKMGIAFSQGDVWYPWHGWIDDVRIYSDALSASEVMALFREGEDYPLPVELSSFTATACSGTGVTLQWISESETNLQGYRIYRNESAELQSALLITPAIISATNGSSQHVYIHRDNEVEPGLSYSYWLEAVELGSSEFFGPVSATLTGGEVPNLPEKYLLGQAYPNPFRAGEGTCLPVSVKEGDSGSLTIYNLKGQAVKTWELTPGSIDLIWDGSDDAGSTCSSGVYFYRLRTDSGSQTKRLVIYK